MGEGGGYGGGDGIRHYVPHVFVVVLHTRHLPPSSFEISRSIIRVLLLLEDSGLGGGGGRGRGGVLRNKENTYFEKCGTRALIREWARTQDTTVLKNLGENTSTTSLYYNDVVPPTINLYIDKHFRLMQGRGILSTSM